MCMTDLDIIERVGKLIAARPTAWKKRYGNGKQVYQVGITGLRSADLMVKLLPFMGLRRREQIVKALTIYAKNRGRAVHSNTPVEE